MTEVAESGGRSAPSAEEQLEKAASKQKARFTCPCDGYLFSLAEFHEARSGHYLRELFKGIPEDEILEGLPASSRSLSGKGRPPFPRRAMLRALFARVALGIPSYAALAERLRQDIVLRYECGFEIGRGTPGEDCLEDFAQLLGKDTDSLEKCLDHLVDELSFKLPGLGESTSWDRAHLPIVKPPQEEEEESPAVTEQDVVDASPDASAEEPAAVPHAPPAEGCGRVPREDPTSKEPDGKGDAAEMSTSPAPKTETSPPVRLKRIGARRPMKRSARNSSSSKTEQRPKASRSRKRPSASSEARYISSWTTDTVFPSRSR